MEDPAVPGASAYRALSYWHDTVPDPLERRPSPAGDLDVDVAVVGAGYTGLWTAYYLATADRHLRVAVLERETAGFGASGRNGGWCSALFPASTTVLARSPLQLRRAEEAVAEARSFGFGEDDLALLGAEEARSLLNATGVAGGTWTPHCAAVHPSRLMRGLAAAVERHGVSLFEGTEVRAIEPGVARTAAGVVRAQHVVRATEGYSPSLPGLRRAIAPAFSLMIATEPIEAGHWAEIGQE